MNDSKFNDKIHLQTVADGEMSTRNSSTLVQGSLICGDACWLSSKLTSTSLNNGCRGGSSRVGARRFCWINVSYHVLFACGKKNTPNENSVLCFTMRRITYETNTVVLVQHSHVVTGKCEILLGKRESHDEMSQKKRRQKESGKSQTKKLDQSINQWTASISDKCPHITEPIYRALFPVLTPTFFMHYWWFLTRMKIQKNGRWELTAKNPEMIRISIKSHMRKDQCLQMMTRQNIQHTTRQDMWPELLTKFPAWLIDWLSGCASYREQSS